jgi:hypothetical protein
VVDRYKRSAHTLSVFRVEKGHFYLEDGGSRFLQNVGTSTKLHDSTCQKTIHNIITRVENQQAVLETTH